MKKLEHGVRGLRPIIFATLLASMMAFAATEPAPLKVGMVPDAGATQVSIQQKAPLQKYLSERLGRPVQLIIPTNYNATVEAIGNGSLDVAYFGGLTYVKARARYGVIPLVQRDIDQKFHSLFIARAGSHIARLGDLRGKTFCFGDINSTSGHLMPRQILKEAGLPADKALQNFRHTGSHPATAQAVATGACDAGALDETVFKSLIDQGKVAGDAVKVFYTSQPFADYVWAARKDLAAAEREAFGRALLSLQRGKDDAVLEDTARREVRAGQGRVLWHCRQHREGIGPAVMQPFAPDVGRPTSGTAPLLELREVAVAPSGAVAPVLTRVSLDIRRGECVALVGPSGSGKTTLLRTIGAMIQPRGGSILFAGQDLSQLSGARLRAVRARIGMITQKHDLVETLRVDKNVMAGALGRWGIWRSLRFLVWAGPAELAEAEGALAAVGLADKLKRPTHALSGGEQQRVAIARVLIQAPSLLLADEPVASLDPVTSEEVLGLLTRLARASGMALICSLHQPELAARFCDRVIETRGGTLVQRQMAMAVSQSAHG